MRVFLKIYVTLNACLKFRYYLWLYEQFLVGCTYLMKKAGDEQQAVKDDS
jgi:hypothetical protein